MNDSMTQFPKGKRPGAKSIVVSQATYDRLLALRGPEDAPDRPTWDAVVVGLMDRVAVLAEALEQRGDGERAQLIQRIFEAGNGPVLMANRRAIEAARGAHGVEAAHVQAGAPIDNPPASPTIRVLK